MPLFNMLRNAVSPSAVETARSAIGAIADRTEGKFSFDSRAVLSEERRLLLEVLDDFLKGPVPEIFRAQHGVAPAVCLSITSVRRQKHDDKKQLVGWHLDLNFAGDFNPFLIAWTAVEDVGEARAALDVCVPRDATLDLDLLLRELDRRSTTGAAKAFSTAEINAFLGEDKWSSRSIVAPAGSAAVFDQMILHRTQHLETATLDRHSIEFRMVDLNRLPAYLRHQSAFYARLSEHRVLEILLISDGKRQPMSVEQFLTLGQGSQ